jgi:methionyl-tRNA synthetase
MDKKFYITAAIPYVNAAPHIGHALEFVQTDTIARYHRLLGEDVLTLSGGDENALKNVQAAQVMGKPVQEFVDKNTEIFFELTKKLNCQFDVWQRGSDQKRHFASAQKLWQLCDKAGDIYKKEYEGLYCVGCEQFYLPSELDEKGECFEHPGKKLEKVAEENYFFKLSKYQKQLIDLIKPDKLKIVPTERKNEILSFLKEPLQDISISRSNERAKNWGVPVPGDPDSRLYVWLDALQIYQTGVGFNWDNDLYKKWWPADLHVIGKGITRFHAVYWPAFLLSAKLELPKAIFAHGYFTVNGQKISKTLGNIIDPVDLIDKFGADALRYYLLAKFQPFTDGDFSEEKLKEVYNGDLANGLGNLVSRIAKLAETSGLDFPVKADQKIYRPEQESAIKDFRFDLALNNIWATDISAVDKHINQETPWTRKGQELQGVLQKEIDDIRIIAKRLSPFLPKTAEKIGEQFKGPKIKSGSPLFPRI